MNKKQITHIEVNSGSLPNWYNDYMDDAFKTAVDDAILNHLGVSGNDRFEVNVEVGYGGYMDKSWYVAYDENGDFVSEGDIDLSGAFDAVRGM